MIDSSLPKPIRDFFSVIRHQHGGKLGLNRQLLLQLIEIGCQERFNKPAGAMYEACMFDKAVFERQQAWVLVAKEKICTLIPDGRYSGSEDMMAWNTGRLDGIFSTKVVATEAIVSSKKNWTDARPNAVNPNATTREEIFSTNYSDADNDEGVARIQAYIRGAAKSKNVRFLDRNPDLMAQTELKLDTLLHGFTKQFNIFGGFIEVYLADGTHDEGSTILLVHGTLCGTGESRSFQSQEAIMVANMAAALLQQISLHVTGNPCMPEDNQPTNDPLTAGYIFQATRKGFHQHSKIAAAIHRQYLSGPDQDAIAQGSRLAGHDADEAMPLGNNNRKAYHGNKHAKDPNAARPVDAVIIDQGMNILSSIESTNAKAVLAAVKKVDALFKSGSALYGRWALLYGRFSERGTAACMEALSKIQTAEKTLRRNVGNTNKHNGQGNKSHSANNDELEEKLEEIRRNGMKMRIRRYQAAKGADRDKLPVFRGCNLPVIGRSSLDAIKTRLKNSRKPGKKQRRVIQGFDISKWGTKTSNKNHDVIVNSEPWCILELVPLNAKISADNKKRAKK